MKKMLIALAATAVLGMGTAMADANSYRRGYSDAVESNGNTCNTYEGTFRGSQNEYDCNRGYVQGKKDMNNASGEN